jgi:hypothetical protein
MDQYLNGFQKNAFLETNQELLDIKTAAQAQQSSLTDLVNIAAYESSYTGALAIFNLGGTSHNDTSKYYWDKPLHITTTDSQFDGVNIIRLQENIVYKPEAADVAGAGPYAAIIIEKDNMTIDLFGFSLILDDINTGNYDEDDCPNGSLSGVTTIHGIYIKPGVKNTRIISSLGQQVKGSIRDFNGYAIFAEGGNTITTDIEQLRIDNIAAANNFGGFSVSYAKEVIISNSETNSNCSINTVYGMSYANVTDLDVYDCKSNSNVSADDVFGIYLKDTVGAKIRNCHANHNESINTGSAYGFTITATSTSTTHSNSIKECIANENICAYADSQESIGFYLTGGSYNNIIENCTSLSNTQGAVSGSPATVPKGYGIKIDNSNYNEIHSNKIGTQLTYGIYDSAAGTSTTLLTRNIAFYNPTNYSISYKTSTGEVTELHTVILYPSDLSGINTATLQLQNFEIKKAESS